MLYINTLSKSKKFFEDSANLISSRKKKLIDYRSNKYGVVGLKASQPFVVVKNIRGFECNSSSEIYIKTLFYQEVFTSSLVNNN